MVFIKHARPFPMFFRNNILPTTKIIVRMEKTSSADFKALKNFFDAISSNQTAQNFYNFEMKSKPSVDSNIKLECSNINEICDCLERIDRHHRE